MTAHQSSRKILRVIHIALLLSFLAWHAGCAHSHRSRSDSNVSIGIASWYGKKYHKKKTASGEKYNMKALTAAHPFLPFGTRVRVTHLENGKSVVVRINDRGPFVKGRIIDLSYRAAQMIDLIQEGVARVRVEVLH